MKISRTWFGTLAVVLLVAGCGDRGADGGAVVTTPSEASSPPAVDEVPADPPPADAVVEPVEAPVTDVFDIASVAVSDRPLGDFPYFSLPEGYVHPNRPVPVRDFDRVAVWTGDRLEWVEGKVYQSLIRADRGKGFSRVELERNIEHQVAEAGGVRVAQSKVPAAVAKQWGEQQAHSPGRGDIYNHPVSTYLVRRADRDIWVHLVSTQSGGSWMVVESAAFTPTSALLPRSELKSQLDGSGRVAVHVNFATDQAEILAESRPQIEEILALLQADPQLRLSVEGHTDDTGGAEHNQRLSEARAQAVVAALAAGGIPASRLQAQGHGQSRPVADNLTGEGRARNRRVELVKQ